MNKIKMDLVFVYSTVTNTTQNVKRIFSNSEDGCILAGAKGPSQILLCLERRTWEWHLHNTDITRQTVYVLVL